MKLYHQAIARISSSLLSSLLPPGKTIDCVADRFGDVDYAWLHRLLQLPDNCRIRGVSIAVFFITDEVGLRIECPDFIGTPEGATIPEVSVLYGEAPKHDGNVTSRVFIGWYGPAVHKTKPSCKWFVDTFPNYASMTFDTGVFPSAICECGAEKTGTTHSDWCPKRKR